MEVQVGFDLRHVRHYSSAKMAETQVTKELADIREQGVEFNIIIVEQRKGGDKADAEDRRYVPLLVCWRARQGAFLSATQAAIFASHRRFQVIA